MDDVNVAIGRNICAQRKRIGLTQEKFADIMSEKTGRSMSKATVSKIEHGHVDLTASFIRAACSVLGCSSYDLYPSAEIYSPSDVHLLGAIKGKSYRTKQILDFLINRWDGDDDAFWEFGLLYAVLDKQDRKYIAEVGIEQFLDSVRNYPESIDEAGGLKVNIDLIKKAAKKLDKN